MESSESAENHVIRGKNEFATFEGVIVVRLREDRRTPLHPWCLQMCGELIGILADSARILREPCRFMLESWPQNATAFASFNAKEFKKNMQEWFQK